MPPVADEEGFDRMDPLHVPAREIPIPSALSPVAQAILSMGNVMGGETLPFPALEDLDGWRAFVAASNELIVPFLEGQLTAAAVDVELRDVGGVPVHVATPLGVDDDRVVLDPHGGGLIFLAGAGCAATAKAAAADRQMTTWGPDYRMPPDHPYPAALDDCMTVYRALIDERSPDRVVISGSSAGGNLAAAMAVRARDEGLRLPGAILLLTPEVDLTESGDSFRTNLGVDTLLGPLMQANLLYAADEDLGHPYLSPLFADLTGFPPTMLVTGTRDLFLSNTVRMHRALRRAGCDAELHVIEAAPHGGFVGSPEQADITAEARRFIDEHLPPR